MAADDDHYAALGLEPGAGRDEVRDAWRFLLAAFHPDRFRDPAQRDRAEEITKRVNAAWQVLGDADARRRYDLRRGRRRSASARARCASSPAPPAPPAFAVRRHRGAAGDALVPGLRRGLPGHDRGALRRAAAPGAAPPAAALRRRLRRRRRDADGRRASGSLPQELALPEGELFSIVFHPRRPRPVYAIVHGETLDVGWRVD